MSDISPEMNGASAGHNGAPAAGAKVDLAADVETVFGTFNIKNDLGWTKEAWGPGATPLQENSKKLCGLLIRNLDVAVCEFMDGNKNLPAEALKQNVEEIVKDHVQKIARKFTRIYPRIKGDCRLDVSHMLTHLRKNFLDVLAKNFEEKVFAYIEENFSDEPPQAQTQIKEPEISSLTPETL